MLNVHVVTLVLDFRDSNLGDSAYKVCQKISINRRYQNSRQDK